MRGLVGVVLGIGIAALAALALVPACSPYDPSLPPAPFLCGDEEPRCPDGYRCVTDRDGKMVCRADAEVDAGASAVHSSAGR